MSVRAQLTSLAGSLPSAPGDGDLDRRVAAAFGAVTVLSGESEAELQALAAQLFARRYGVATRHLRCSETE